MGAQVAWSVGNCWLSDVLDQWSVCSSGTRRSRGICTHTAFSGATASTYRLDILHSGSTDLAESDGIKRFHAEVCLLLLLSAAAVVVVVVCSTAYQHKQVCIALSSNPLHSYGASPAIWNYTVFPATQHRWTCLILTPDKWDVPSLLTMEGWKAELTYEVSSTACRHTTTPISYGRSPHNQQ